VRYLKENKQKISNWPQKQESGCQEERIEKKGHKMMTILFTSKYSFYYSNPLS
jgi:hypothetical protein